MPILNLPDVKINYLQIPQDSDSHLPKKHLVMIHGIATNLAFWYHCAQAFTATHTVTLFDLRGHGRSSMPATGYTPAVMAEDLKHLLDHLCIDTADFVGHSFGGSVLLHFATLYPERVRHIVLADARLKLLQPQQKVQDWVNWQTLKPHLAQFGINLSEDNPEAGFQLLVDIARLQVNQPQGKIPFPKTLSSIFPQGGNQRTAKKWLKLWDTTTAKEDFQTKTFLTIKQLQQLQKPTLAIYGEKSPTLPTAAVLSEIWSHLHFQFVPNAGHFFPLSQPDFFVNKVQKFLYKSSVIN